jgi:hypothetical protein
MAHRWAWRDTGHSLEDVQVLMHICDVRNCVNPDHLRPGTDRENQADKVSKNRQAKGSKIHNSILTEQDVSAIRAAMPTRSNRQLANQYGVCISVIQGIAKRKSWKHVG